MSLERIENVVCPNCGAEGSYTLWQSINTQVDPDMKEKVRNASIFTYLCPCCMTKYDVNNQVFYHQQEDSIAIYCGDASAEQEIRSFIGMNKQMEQMMNSSLGSFLPKYINRYVPNIQCLLEKLRIFDAGYDDRVIELLKAVMVSKWMNDNRVETIGEIVFDRQGGRDYYLVFGANGRLMHKLPIEHNVLAQMTERLQRVMPPLRNDDNYKVDKDWAVRTLTNQ